MSDPSVTHDDLLELSQSCAASLFHIHANKK